MSNSFAIVSGGLNLVEEFVDPRNGKSIVNLRFKAAENASHGFLTIEFCVTACHLQISTICVALTDRGNLRIELPISVLEDFVSATPALAGCSKFVMQLPVGDLSKVTLSAVFDKGVRSSREPVFRFTTSSSE
jgi:hypothetical protein